MNLLFSYGVQSDEQFAADGHTFLGAATNAEGSEVHVFLKKDEPLASPVPLVRGARLRKLCQMSGNEPFTQDALQKRMDALCGCRGCFDCDCVTIQNQAFRDLWSEYNSRVSESRQVAGRNCS